MEDSRRRIVWRWTGVEQPHTGKLSEMLLFLLAFFIMSPVLDAALRSTVVSRTSGALSDRHLDYVPHIQTFLQTLADAQPRDFIILVDRTGSSRRSFYRIEQNLVTDLLRHHVNIQKDNVRVAIVAFGTDPKVIVDGITDGYSKTKCHILRKWQELLHDDKLFSSQSNIVKAFEKAEEIFKQSKRSPGNHTKYILTISDGSWKKHENDPTSIRWRLSRPPISATFFSIGLGKDLDEQIGNVRSLASYEWYYGNASLWVHTMSNTSIVAENNNPFLEIDPGGPCNTGIGTSFCEVMTGDSRCLCRSALEPLKVPRRRRKRQTPKCDENPLYPFERVSSISERDTQNDCNNVKCKNGGTCVDGQYSAVCICPWGFRGRSCETDHNDCVLGICDGNERCTDLVNDVNCTCTGQRSGHYCEHGGITSTILTNGSLAAVVVMAVFLLVVIILLICFRSVWIAKLCCCCHNAACKCRNKTPQQPDMVLTSNGNFTGNGHQPPPYLPTPLPRDQQRPYRETPHVSAHGHRPTRAGSLVRGTAQAVDSVRRKLEEFKRRRRPVPLPPTARPPSRCMDMGSLPNVDDDSDFGDYENIPVDNNMAGWLAYVSGISQDSLCRIDLCISRPDVDSWVATDHNFRVPPNVVKYMKQSITKPYIGMKITFRERPYNVFRFEGKVVLANRAQKGQSRLCVGTSGRYVAIAICPSDMADHCFEQVVWICTHLRQSQRRT